MSLLFKASKSNVILFNAPLDQETHQPTHIPHEKEEEDGAQLPQVDRLQGDGRPPRRPLGPRVHPQREADVHALEDPGVDVVELVVDAEGLHVDDVPVEVVPPGAVERVFEAHGVPADGEGGEVEVRAAVVAHVVGGQEAFVLLTFFE